MRAINPHPGAAALPELLQLVRHAIDTAIRCLSGIDTESSIPTVVLSVCNQLREVALDEAAAHLVAVVDRAAGKLQQHMRAAQGSASELSDPDASEIVLIKGLWELESRLARLAVRRDIAASE